MKTICKKANGEEFVLEETPIPDMWSLVMWLENYDGIRKGLAKIRDNETWYRERAKETLVCWHLCHDLRNALLTNKVRWEL